jgi:hypothetical protein
MILDRLGINLFAITPKPLLGTLRISQSIPSSATLNEHHFMWHCPEPSGFQSCSRQLGEQYDLLLHPLQYSAALGSTAIKQNAQNALQESKQGMAEEDRLSRVSWNFLLHASISPSEYFMSSMENKRSGKKAIAAMIISNIIDSDLGFLSARRTRKNKPSRGRHG